MPAEMTADKIKENVQPVPKFELARQGRLDFPPRRSDIGVRREKDPFEILDLKTIYLACNWMHSQPYLTVEIDRDRWLAAAGVHV